MIAARTVRRWTALGATGAGMAVVAIAFAAPTPITLPPETAALKPSSHPGYAIASQKCGICHSADYVDYQPPGMTLTQWTGEMKKMRALYGAPLDDRDIELVAAYLTTTYGDAATVVAQPPSAATAPVTTAAATDVKSLLDHNGCLACHAIDKTVVGPAFHAVAARYGGNAEAVATVRSHIREGGSGRWGTVPMPSFASLTSGEATTLAEFVLKQ